RPSAVQAAVFDTISNGENCIVGAETGSGKTLAYLLPLVEDILKRKREWKAAGGNGIMDPGYDYARAIILVPNKELANQAVRMAASICGGLDRCVIWVPSMSSSTHVRQPPPDLVFATPAALGPMGLSPKNIEFFADVPTLVVDEADMLLDGGYVRELNNALMGFRRADRLVGRYEAFTFKKKNADDCEEKSDEEDSFFDDKPQEKEQKRTQHIFVAATLPDYGLRSVDAYLQRKFPDAKSITMAGMHNARHYGLEQESQTVWDEIEENRDRMKRLVDVLRLEDSQVGVDGRGMKGEKVMVFLNSVNDVDGATNGLRRAGINAVPYHAKIPLEERASNLDKFRRYRVPSGGNDDNDEDTVPVLVCTDLASRGLDIPGVSAVVQLQFAGNVVSHLHRMGRCGRAGNRDGRGIVYYGPAERELVEVVREAEAQQSRMTLSQDVDDDALGDDEDGEGAGKVKKAFSRKRGFTKKRKKERRETREGGGMTKNEEEDELGTGTTTQETSRNTEESIPCSSDGQLKSFSSYRLL
ncbi:RNA helicase, partial [Thalassiosira pseudonana CCMP1335]